MKRLLVCLILAGLTLTGVFARDAKAAANPDAKYYDQLFAGDQFNVTVALSFEQVRSGIKTPVIGTVVDAFEAPKRDVENTMNDVAAIENGITACQGCPFIRQSQVTGMRVYTGVFTYGSRKISGRVRFLFSEPGTSIGFLKSQFIDAMKNDNVILYLGHSRHGDGFPDFAAPIADSGKIFKNDPVQGWIGFDKGYFSRTKYQLLMLSSCQTERYYRDVLRQRIWEKPPSTLGLMLSTDDTWFDDYPSTTAAVISGLVNQLDRTALVAQVNDAADYYNSLHVQDKNPKGLFSFDGVFDDTYVGKAPGKRISPQEPFRSFPF